MAREILDSIVRKNCYKTEEGVKVLEEYDCMPAYRMSVCNTLNKVDLKKVNINQVVTLQVIWESKYRALELRKDVEPLIAVEGKVIKCSYEMIRVLKFLAVEQINMNSDYSRILANIFMQIVEQLSTTGYTGEFKFDKKNKMEKYLVEELTEFLKVKLANEPVVSVIKARGKKVK